MPSGKTGRRLLIIGLAGTIVTALSGLFVGPETQPVRILGIEIFGLIVLTGVWLELRTTTITTRYINAAWLVDRIVNLPTIFWVFSSFCVVYLLCFIGPVFFGENLRIHYLTNYLPDQKPIGNDLLVVINQMKGWFYENKSPYEIQFYPPFTYVFLAPLLLFDDYSFIYKLFTIFNVICYLLLSFLIPLKMSARKNASLLILLLVTGLFSYGLQFELERGQLNILAFLLCLWAIYLFHNHPRYRLFAYLLFSMSIHLKLYPAIFLVMFIDRWQDWKINLRRFAGLGLFNLLLLFTMGYSEFQAFMRAVLTQLTEPEWLWNGNHSVNAFVAVLSESGFHIIKPDQLELIRQNSGLLVNLFLFIFLAAFVITIILSARRNTKGADAFLLLACLIGALIIPVSNDYKLSIFPAAMAVFLCNLPVMKRRRYQLAAQSLTLFMSVAYFLTLVPYKYKPEYLANTFPLLFIILILSTLLNLIHYMDSKTDTSPHLLQEP